MICRPSLTGFILLHVMQACLCGNCTTSQIYLLYGESLTALTQRCSCIDAWNDPDKVYDFAVNQICYNNWLAISTQNSESNCSGQSFNAITKSCCNIVWASTLLQLPTSCVASLPEVPKNTTITQPNENISSDGNSTRIPEYLAGFLIPFVVGITGAILAYIKGWCFSCVEKLPEKSLRTKSLFSKSTGICTDIHTNFDSASINSSNRDAESLGVPDLIEVREINEPCTNSIISKEMRSTASMEPKNQDKSVTRDDNDRSLKNKDSTRHIEWIGEIHSSKGLGIAGDVNC